MDTQRSGQGQRTADRDQPSSSQDSLPQGLPMAKRLFGRGGRNYQSTFQQTTPNTIIIPGGQRRYSSHQHILFIAPSLLGILGVTFLITGGILSEKSNESSFLPLLICGSTITLLAIIGYIFYYFHRLQAIATPEVAVVLSEETGDTSAAGNGSIKELSRIQIKQISSSVD